MAMMHARDQTDQDAASQSAEVPRLGTAIDKECSKYAPKPVSIAAKESLLSKSTTRTSKTQSY